MNDRVDELKGTVKAKVGRLMGNERMDLAGKKEVAVARAKRKTKGALKQVSGTLKESVGRLLDNESLELEGKAQKLRGEAEQSG